MSQQQTQSKKQKDKPLFVYLITEAQGSAIEALGQLPQPIAERRWCGKEYTWIIYNMKEDKVSGTYSGYFVKKVSNLEEFRELAQELKGPERVAAEQEKKKLMEVPA